MKLGVNTSRKVECKRHNQFHNCDEACPYCDPNEDYQPEDTIPAWEQSIYDMYLKTGWYGP